MSNYNNGNNNKNKSNSKEKNSFFNTNYRQKNVQSKFNSIGKIISMNYPYISNDKTKKQFSKNKIILNKSKSPNTNNININVIQSYNSKSEHDLYSNFSENDLYGNGEKLSKNSTPKKFDNNINRLNIAFKGEDKQNQISSLHNGEAVYRNFFLNNKFQGKNYYNTNKIINQTHNIFFSNSSEKYKKGYKKNNIQDNKSNDSFSTQNQIENNMINSSDFHKKIMLNKEIKKKTIDISDTKELKNNNSPNNNYFISNYGSYTLGGIDIFGHPKTNQDSYMTKEENLINNKEYTFGVFDGHGLQGHLVSEGIKNYLMNVTYDQYSSQQKIISMFNSLSKSIESSKNFDVFCSGSTAVLVHITKEKIICSNCGDSRAILINDINNEITKLSRDHKPNLLEEKKRILASGGRVEKFNGMGPFRVWSKDGDYPGLAMSRSIGDTLAHKIGVSSTPEIMEFNINSLKPLAIVIASDGVWEFMTVEQVKNIIIKYKNNHDAFACSKEIVEKARQIWKRTSFAIDDITCVIVFFDKN